MIKKYKISAPGCGRFFFYRTRQGDEIDLLVQEDKKLTAYEIKTKTSVDIRELTGFLRCLEHLSIKEGVVIYWGEKSFRLNPKIKVQSIHSLHEM